MKNIKENIETLLLDLKQMGYGRIEIEKELDYSPKYLNQILSKGGNSKVLNSLIRYKKEKLQNATNIQEQNSSNKIKVSGDEKEVMARMSEQIVAANAAIKILILRLAEAEAKVSGKSFSAEVTKLTKEIRDQHKSDVSQSQTLF